MLKNVEFLTKLQIKNENYYGLAQYRKFGSKKVPI